jgi:hypothetical protein
VTNELEVLSSSSFSKNNPPDWLYGGRPIFPPAIPALKSLPSHLRRKAEAVLRFYGGVEGLSKNPPWVISIVLQTWFTEAERHEILDAISRGMEKQARRLVLRDLEAR